MEVAAKAEDWTPQDEERVEADRIVEEFLLELGNITRCNPQKYHATLAHVTCEMLRTRERERESKPKQRRECEAWRRKA